MSTRPSCAARAVVAALVAATGSACAPSAADAPRLPSVGPAPDRPICGWEDVDPEAPHLQLSLGKPMPKAGAGDRVLVLVADDAVPMSAVAEALAPASGLVRVKIAVEGRWLLPVTYQEPRLPAAIAPEETVVSIVGHQRVTRPKSAPALRLADLQLDGERLTLFVENEVPAGVELAVGELAARLKQQDPPVRAFTLRATPATPWRSYVAAVQAAACHDLRPGDEPHEVIAVPAADSDEEGR